MPMGYDAIYDINNVQCLVKLAYTLIVCRYVYDINNVQCLVKLAYTLIVCRYVYDKACPCG